MNGKKPHYTKEEAHDICLMYQDNVPVKKIIKETGITVNIFNKIMRNEWRAFVSKSKFTYSKIDKHEKIDIARDYLKRLQNYVAKTQHEQRQVMAEVGRVQEYLLNQYY